MFSRSGISTNLLQKQNLKLKQEFDFSDDEDMEIIDLAQDYSTSYPDLAARDYRKLHNLHSNVQEDKSLRLITQKPQYQYGSGKPPQLPFAPNDPNSEDFFGGMDDQDDDFPPPSALIHGSKNKHTTLSSPYELPKVKKYASIGDSSYSGAAYEDDATDFLEDDVTFPDQPSELAYGNDSMDSLEAGMLELEDSMAEQAPVAASPKLNSSFADRIFDFDACNNGGESQNSRQSTSANQATKFAPFDERPTQQPAKRARSPTPEDKVVKCRRVSKNHNITQASQAEQEKPAPVYPEWLNEFDSDLIDGFKDVVEFID